MTLFTKDQVKFACSTVACLNFILLTAGHYKYFIALLPFMSQDDEKPNQEYIVLFPVFEASNPKSTLYHGSFDTLSVAILFFKKILDTETYNKCNSIIDAFQSTVETLN
jgi:hypothetical protein